jgi:hypothetical protein
MKGMKTQYQIDVERNARILKRDRASYLEVMFGRFMTWFFQLIFCAAIGMGIIILILFLLAR